MEPCYAAHFSSREWASKVNSVAPYLNAQGLHRALAILDQATRNVQQAQALEEAKANTQEVAHGHPYFLCGSTCAMLQAQLYEQQQRLLADLERLPLDLASARDHALPSAAVVAAAASLGEIRLGFTGKHAMPEFVGLPDNEQGVQKPQAVDSTAAVPPVSRKVQTLSTSLQLLSCEDPDCLFIVRRINKLGFKAVRTLKRHFSAQGPVMKVLLAHSTVRQHGDPTCHARRRPSSLGFVQMATAEAAAKVLALGIEQQVDGVLIRVQKFERQYCTQELNEDEELTDSRTGSKRNTNISEASTTASPLASPNASPFVPSFEEFIEASPSPLTSPLLNSTQVVDVVSDRDLDCEGMALPW